MEIYEEGHPNYNPERSWMNWEWVPTGVHGKYQPCYITRYIEVYPANWAGKWEDWPRLQIHFKCGRIQDFTDVTGR
jgi:hypothetical protein